MAGPERPNKMVEMEEETEKMRGRRGGRQGRWQKQRCGQEKRMIFLPTELLAIRSPFKLENEAKV